MKVLLLILLPLFSYNCFSFSNNDFQPGDVILLDLDCFSCQMIEDESGGRFSHSGLVVSNGRELLVVQSLGNVHFLKLSNFLNYSDKFVVIRPKSSNSDFRDNHWQIFKDHFEGIDFDHNYTWEQDKLYCSEFIFKFMNHFFKFKDLSPVPMNYTRNWDFWVNYFGHRPPQGELGLSPNDFFRSNDFKITYDSQQAVL